jgi:hypothetical protein
VNPGGESFRCNFRKRFLVKFESIAKAGGDARLDLSF